jgi:hypothetical protein
MHHHQKTLDNPEYSTGLLKIFVKSLGISNSQFNQGFQSIAIRFNPDFMKNI